jgi:hypothetical protein
MAMRKAPLLTVWAFVCAAACSAQQVAAQAAAPQGAAQAVSQGAAASWKFRSDDYVGLASGQWGNYGLLQTVNGVSRGPWFLGLGAGLDNYRFQSAPLFVSVTRDIPVFRDIAVVSKKGDFFLNLDGGTNLPLYNRDIIPYVGAMTSKFHAGSWWSGGLGYKWPLSSRSGFGHSGKALLVSVNYSEKRLKEVQKVPPPPYACDPGACPLVDQTFIFDYLNRVFLFKIGLQF